MHTTYVINLESREDRRAAMGQELSRVGWTAEIFAAVRPSEPAGFPSIGARGCFLSHLGVLKKAAHAGAQRLIILEDDLNFVRDFTSRWAAAMEALEQREWSMFYAGHGLPDLQGGLTRIAPETGVKCAHFMMINGSAIPVLIDGLEAILSRPPGDARGGPMHVDGAYSTVRRQNPRLAAFAHAPALGYQRPSRTDISDTRWFDRLTVLAPILSLARSAKERAVRARRDGGC